MAKQAKPPVSGSSSSPPARPQRLPSAAAHADAARAYSKLAAFHAAQAAAKSRDQMRERPKSSRIR